MRLPVIHGLIDRRILVNYRVDPQVALRLLPRPFRPRIVGGHAMAGICLIRLKHLRPRWLSYPIGIGSENAAHRFAVEWDQNDQTRDGVFVPRRDSNSRLNSLVGGRLIPGIHHHARFNVIESGDHLRVDYKSDDGQTRVSFDAQVADHLAEGSIFKSTAQASAFFERGSIGYSTTREEHRLDGLELRCRQWSVLPLKINAVRSSFFEDISRFPAGTAQLDCALLMRGIEHEWHALGDLSCSAATR